MCVSFVMSVCGDYFCAELGCVVSVKLWLCASMCLQMCDVLELSVIISVEYLRSVCVSFWVSQSPIVLCVFACVKKVVPRYLKATFARVASSRGSLHHTWWQRWDHLLRISSKTQQQSRH